MKNKTVFDMPVWVLNGKNYAFLRWIDSHLVHQLGLSMMTSYYSEYPVSMN